MRSAPTASTREGQSVGGPVAKSIFFSALAACSILDKPESTPSGVHRCASPFRPAAAAQPRGSSGKFWMVWAIASKARSRSPRSWVAITLVRSSAPPGGTAGWIATLV
jgi:hypothetical protein